MTDLEILQNGSISEKVYNVFEKYKPLIMKKASLYERCSKGRIQKEDFISDVYEVLYYFVGRMDIKKVKNVSNFSYYKSVQFAILRTLKKNRKIFDKECLFQYDEDGNETTQLVSKLGFSELAPDISKFMDRLTDRQKYILERKMKGETHLQIRTKLKLSHGMITHEMVKVKNIYNEFFSMEVWNMKKIKSIKLEIEIKNKKIQRFVEKIIKENELKKDNGDYIYNESKFTLFNTNQYKFTEIRNEIFHKKINYEEFEEFVECW